jgi:hypothetical protein
MNLFTTIIALFRKKARLTLGISRSSKGLHHAYCAVFGDTRRTLLSAGGKVPLLMRFFTPPVVNDDLGNTPIFLTAAEIGSADPEGWIDRNEEKIFPAGLPSDQAVNDYIVEGGTLYSATASKKAIDAILALPREGLVVQSLGVPLWNLAILYGKEIASPFILWKIGVDGSVLGFVENGRLMRLLHSAVGSDDLGSDTAGSCSMIGLMARSLCGGDAGLPLVVFSPEPEFKALNADAINGFRMQASPKVKGVPAWCHEAYANALFGDGGMNFVHFEAVQKAGRLDRRFATLRRVARLAFTGVMGLLIVLLGSDAILQAVSRHYHAPMEQLQTQGRIIVAAQKKQEILVKKYREKAKFATERSRCTALLSDLQTVFPEGVWAEGLSITEMGKSGWQCDIQALARSNGFIGIVLENLGRVPGVSNPRMAYSEQIELPDKSRAVRFKIKCDWR